ncbi:MAG TPA: orotidine-5'-phosphate decarboxylase, partial [Fibrobacteraceae bacterium]|nr:orotidine-5'-phosphate decarboxylase [Fibrobacteraceae bacterium]
MVSQNFSSFLEKRIAECGNPVCMGMDPVLDLIPLEGTPEEKVKRFYFEILEEILRRGVSPAVIKPNSAYYECISIDALRVLQDIIKVYQSAG